MHYNAGVSDPIIDSARLSAMHWPTVDPFLFCAHHLDDYPAGNERLGPRASLAGRHLGQDFEGKDGWRMYHGSVVPGFPQHPHRGFETISIMRRGMLDHSDSLGAKARFGEGDVQWMTAGRGIVHSEMFPLLDSKAQNPAELFQIWLNLPKKNKLAEPAFAMFWNETIPNVVIGTGPKATVRVIAGELSGERAPAPPPASWASNDESDVAVFFIELEAGAKLKLPPARSAETLRTLYFHRGERLRIASRAFDEPHVVIVQSDRAIELEASGSGASVLVLQGRPLREPVAHHGPFVMNTADEIREAIRAYTETRFGGWPWESDDPVHGPEPRRFAVHPDGHLDEPDSDRS